MKLAIGNDHAGLDLKTRLVSILAQRGVEVIDMGTNGNESVDYPDFAMRVAGAVSKEEAQQGILVCGSGIGMSIVANKFTGVRAALCYDNDTAKLSRAHNDANVLVLGGRLLENSLALEIVHTWLDTKFEGGRHAQRTAKIQKIEREQHEAAAKNMPVGRGRKWSMSSLKETDPEIFQTIRHEIKREQERIILIASENYASQAVLEAQGCVMTNKYAEGYPGKRYYGGCDFVDMAESLAIDRAKTLFGAEHANVQPHSGTQSNMAVYLAMLKPGDTILSMNLAHGGHLSHGHAVNFSGSIYNPVFYGVGKDTGVIDYQEVESLAMEHHPKLLIVGASAYSRSFDFKRFREIADKAGALMMVDMAHIAGLVAAGVHPSPVPYADFVTSTTQKTLRGPRGGMILCKAQYAKAIDKAVFPGIQGGPLMHVIAAKAVAFKEAMTPEFKAYQQQVVENAQALSQSLKDKGYHIVSGETDNHLFLVDLRSQQITGQDAEFALDMANITINKNAVPFDDKPPTVTSGIRLGTPSVTSRGMGVEEMHLIAEMIHQVIQKPDTQSVRRKAQTQVKDLCKQFPIYK